MNHTGLYACSINETFDCVIINITAELFSHLTIAERHNGRHGHHAILDSHIAQLVDIDLGQEYTTTARRYRRLESRTEHATRSTPLGMKVDNHRRRTVQYSFLEVVEVGYIECRRLVFMLCAQ